MPAKRCQPDFRMRARILVVDSHPITRYGIARLIDKEPGLMVCSESGNVPGALAAIKTLKPQLVLTDLNITGGDALEFIKDVQTHYPEVTLLVVTMHDEIFYAERALRAGARGYIMKDEPCEEVIEAIRHVLRGKIYISKKMSGKVLDIFSGRHRREDDTTTGNLTDREFEVFGLIGHGMTTSEIAKRLGLSPKTVETHRIHIREKLHLDSGAALIQYAVRWSATRALI